MIITHIIIVPILIHTVYGWTDDFPIEVTKGQVLELNIGYLKGSPSIRRGFEIMYDPSREFVLTYKKIKHC